MQSRRAKIKQAALRHALEAVLDEHRLAALVYPTLRRRPARIGEAQGGTTCQVSAHSGLPALGVPAGFTDDDVPVGMDLLGAAFDESRLLSLGYAIEKTLALRHAAIQHAGARRRQSAGASSRDDFPCAGRRRFAEAGARGRRCNSVTTRRRRSCSTRWRWTNARRTGSSRSG